MRETGFYWVKYHGHWEVALLDNGFWYLTASQKEIKPEMFDFINETRILNPDDIHS